jgi:hypothetical protein
VPGRPLPPPNAAAHCAPSPQLPKARAAAHMLFGDSKKLINSITINNHLNTLSHAQIQLGQTNFRAGLAWSQRYLKNSYVETSPLKIFEAISALVTCQHGGGAAPAAPAASGAEPRGACGAHVPGWQGPQG